MQITRARMLIRRRLFLVARGPGSSCKLCTHYSVNSLTRWTSYAFRSWLLRYNATHILISGWVVKYSREMNRDGILSAILCAACYRKHLKNRYYVCKRIYLYNTHMSIYKYISCHAARKIRNESLLYIHMQIVYNGINRRVYAFYGLFIRSIDLFILLLMYRVNLPLEIRRKEI